ncbi:hypothetical protein E2C01_097800 [Portunus trituberculatus]|uniref:Uncharacterized protein n=1 Tax=Portunus trituberculatus TaxID=210409 RepID=A0A5B7JZK5_PORTR|nr:hypothetical protein [Portunus trituberculatus]
MSLGTRGLTLRIWRGWPPRRPSAGLDDPRREEEHTRHADRSVGCPAGRTRPPHATNPLQ